MKQSHTTTAIAFGLWAAACTVSNSKPPGNALEDASTSCAVAEPLRCEGNTLVRCSGDGTPEVRETCPLGCTADLRCADSVPSNGLATYIDQASSKPDLDLGDSATIDTDTGEVNAGGTKLGVFSDIVAQTSAPIIRVFVVRSLTANNVVVTGTKALAIISSGDIKINGRFAASAQGVAAGAGAFNEGGCRGQDAPNAANGFYPGGAGGGGFGGSGGSGGHSSSNAPGKGGTPTGNASLIPLRGGCDGGFVFSDKRGGGGGGAIQLFSRTQIVVHGALAANGGGARLSGGGSGGGILLEAPTVTVSGGVLANGGSGGANESGRDGGWNDSPAAGADKYDNPGFGDIPSMGRGGNGAAGSTDATPGTSVTTVAIGGNGGGGFGRIRVNTLPGGLQKNGTFSPKPSEGPLAAR